MVTLCFKLADQEHLDSDPFVVQVMSAWLDAMARRSRPKGPPLSCGERVAREAGQPTTEHGLTLYEATAADLARCEGCGHAPGNARLP
jgi:hypothetical protein